MSERSTVYKEIPRGQPGTLFSYGKVQMLGTHCIHTCDIDISTLAVIGWQ